MQTFSSSFVLSSSKRYLTTTKKTICTQQQQQHWQQRQQQQHWRQNERMWKMSFLSYFFAPSLVNIMHPLQDLRHDYLCTTLCSHVWDGIPFIVCIFCGNLWKTILNFCQTQISISLFHSSPVIYPHILRYFFSLLFYCCCCCCCCCWCCFCCCYRGCCHSKCCCRQYLDSY